jgi:peptide/nickel transport system ATP-binding protein
LFDDPRHPYTARLMSSTPRQDSTLASLLPVPGALPDLRRTDLPNCRFIERCERASDACLGPLPALDAGVAHSVACWHPRTRDAHV